MLDRAGRETLVRRAWALCPDLAPQIEMLAKDMNETLSAHESRLKIIRGCLPAAVDREQGQRFIRLEVEERTFRNLLNRTVVLAERDLT